MISGQYLGVVPLLKNIFRVKSSTRFNMTKNYTYSIQYNGVKVYKGKTCCPLKIKLEEHLKAVVRGEIEKPNMTDHILKEKKPYGMKLK